MLCSVRHWWAQPTLWRTLLCHMQYAMLQAILKVRPNLVTHSSPRRPSTSSAPDAIEVQVISAVSCSRNLSASEEIIVNASYNSTLASWYINLSLSFEVRLELDSTRRSWQYTLTGSASIATTQGATTSAFQSTATAGLGSAVSSTLSSCKCRDCNVGSSSYSKAKSDGSLQCNQWTQLDNQWKLDCWCSMGKQLKLLLLDGG